MRWLEFFAFVCWVAALAAIVIGLFAPMPTIVRWTYVISGASLAIAGFNIWRES